MQSYVMLRLIKHFFMLGVPASDFSSRGVSLVGEEEFDPDLVETVDDEVGISPRIFFNLSGTLTTAQVGSDYT